MLADAAAEPPDDGASDAGGDVSLVADARPLEAAPPAADADATAPDASDASDASDGFTPAPHAPYPVVPDLGGPRLDAMQIVPVYFGDDPLRDALDAFHAWIAASDFFRDLGGEYGIGPPRVLDAVTIDAPPDADLDDVDVRAWLASRILLGTLPPPTDETAYVLYYPAGTSIAFSGATSCTGFAAYHAHVHVAAAGFDGEVPYAVVPRCGVGEHRLVRTTNAASHELIEVATDPICFTHPAFRLDPPLGDPLEAWTMLGGAEVSDLCTSQSFDDAFPFRVQDSWSNVAARAGRNPCQPSDPARPFFAVSTDSTTFHASPGQTLHLRAVAWSSAPTPAWTLGIDTSYAPPSDFDGAASPSRSTVANGDVIDVVVTIPSELADASSRSVYRFTIDSLDASEPGFYHPWPVMVVVP